MAAIHGKNYGEPTLDLNFAGNKSLVDTTTEKNYVTFSRAQSGNEATYIGSDGLIKYAAADEARFDHDPATLQSLGLLIEESRTNKFLYSEDFSDASWIKSNTTVTTNLTSAPDDTNTADKLVTTNTNSSHYVVNVLAVTAASHTVTIFSKSAEKEWLTINIYNGSTYLKYSFNVSNGQLGISAAGGTPTITQLANGWYKCTVSYTSTVTGNNSIHFHIYDDSSTENFQGDGTSGLYVWGAQFEENKTFPTSYIPTSGTTVTRAADVASITGTNFSNFYNNTEGTWFTDMALGFTQNAGNPFIFGGVYYTTVVGAVRTLANTPTIMGGLSNSQTVLSKTAVALKSQDFAVYRDGTLTGSNNSTVYTPTGTQWRINSSLGSLGRIKRVTYWPKRLPDIELQQLTK